jgi:hypothetical protein
MSNRVYPDMNQLRTHVNNLIDEGRVRVHRHARTGHPELSLVEQVAIVRYGGAIKPDRDRGPDDGVSICWASLPNRGRCRGVFCVEESPSGDSILVITGFEE